MPVLYFDGWYTAELCDRNPEMVFIFGDNTKRLGQGGQAVIRRLPNALGIVTKRKGDMHRDSFFVDGNEKDKAAVDMDLEAVRLLLVAGKTVVIPVRREDGQISLGLERARLPETAPLLKEHIDSTIRRFAEEFGSERFVPAVAAKT